MPREVSRVHAIHRSAQHFHVWLSASGRTYGAVAREAFVRGHPLLFGRAYALTMHGFEHGRERHAIADSAEAFARFIARRHQRWMDSLDPTPSMAPCLVGSASTEPCWLAADQTLERRAA
jgi:hypothetical protein